MEKVGTKRNRVLRAQPSGYVLVVVLVIAGILAITGTGLLSLSLNGYRRAVYAAQEIAAQNAAEAGVAKALFALKSYAGGDLPSATDESLPNCSAYFTYRVTADSSGGFVLDATGTSENATKTIHTRLVSQTMTFCGITLNQSARIRSRAQVLAASGSSKPRLLTNSIATGAINLEASTITFQGDIVVGPGGDPAAVIVGGGVVSGTISAAAAATVFPAVTAPTGLPQRGNITGSTRIDQDGQYGEIDLTGNGKEVTIEGNRIVYVTGTVNLQNKAHIIVTPGSSLTLFVGGDVIIQHNAYVQEENYDPTKVLILGTAGCAQIDFDDAVCYGGFYAPAATVKMHDSAELHGAFACNILNPMESGAKLYYDDRLQTVAVSGGTSTHSVSSWQDQRSAGTGNHRRPLDDTRHGNRPTHSRHRR